MFMVENLDIELVESAKLAELESWKRNDVYREFHTVNKNAYQLHGYSQKSLWMERKLKRQEL